MLHYTMMIDWLIDWLNDWLNDRFDWSINFQLNLSSIFLWVGEWWLNSTPEIGVIYTQITGINANKKTDAEQSKIPTSSTSFVS
jgi:hypothetical protein